MKWVVSALAILLATCAAAQTTQGAITGRIYDKLTQQLLPNAVVTCTDLATLQERVTTANAAGLYSFLSLSPGTYRVRASADQYQPNEAPEVVIFVASRVDLSFPLRPVGDVLDRSSGNTVILPDGDVVLPIIGPDLERGQTVDVQRLPQQDGTLFSTLSYVIDRNQIDNLPLTGRDVYTMLVTLPSVTADNATGRGLGLSVNGQRPSSSNFLLDGVENNDYLLTGPFALLAPEAVEEYRVSTNNFSAEFGRTGGFVANVVTRSGGNDAHGLAYAYLNNDALNANSFQNNSHPDLPRNPRKQLNLGVWAGGPLRRNRLYFSTALERFRSRERQNPDDVAVPLPDCIRLQPNADPSALELLTRFPPPPVPHSSCGLFSGSLHVSAPASLDRTLAVERFDAESANRAHRITVRLALSYVSQPDFTYSLYQGFNSELDRNARSLAASYTRAFQSTRHNEVKFAWRDTLLALNRPHPEVATLESPDVALPGSTNAYELRSRDRNWELADSFTALSGRHTLTAGGGLLARRLENLLSFGRDGAYSFDNVAAFALTGPSLFTATVDRLSQDNTQPRYDRDYSNSQFFGFIQDSVRLTRRLQMNAGARYESFGVLRNTSTPNVVFEPGPGNSIDERIATGNPVPSGTDLMTRPDRNNWAARAGIAYDVGGNGITVLRAGFGIFYDRLFDSLFLTTALNNAVLRTYGIVQPHFDYFQPVGMVLQQFRGQPASDAPFLLWTDDSLRTPYVQSWFVAIRRQVSHDLSLEIAQSGALARKLIVTDIVNRKEYPAGTRPNPALDDMQYRSNSGASDYFSLTASTRYRAAPWMQLQAAYTYGHSIDNQSEPLLGEFANLSYTAGVSRSQGLAAFTREFDSRADRGSSDFDQRQNLVITAIWQMPELRGGSWRERMTRNWQLAAIAGFRSGFPYTVFGCADNETCVNAPPEGATLIRNRPDLLPGHDPELPSRPQLSSGGGVQLLDPSSFRSRTDGSLGSMGRNSLTGPGFWNIDASIARSFPFPWGGETRRIQLRADFFNLLNHANLGNPVASRADDAFGAALYGRSGFSSPLLVVPPLNESSRRIQLQLKVYF
jgi:hypothetical protein